MKALDLERANTLQIEIKKLDSFLFTAERTWTGKLVKKSLFSIISNGFGAFESKEYHLDTNLKDKMLDVLRTHLEEMKKELESI